MSTTIVTQNATARKTRRIPRLGDLLYSGELDGYDARPPHGSGAVIDADICSRLTCHYCGKQGLSYRPFVRRQPRFSYRVFAVCPDCGACEEF